MLREAVSELRANQTLMSTMQLTDIRRLGEPNSEICLIMMNYYGRAQWDFRVDARLTRVMAY
eukprot:11164517-Lingulodinium_polyedra.AAC.1